MSVREEIHYTTEEIMSMPGYCRDRYEREISKVRCENNGLNMKVAMDEIKIGLLEGKLEQANKIVDRFLDPHEDCCEGCYLWLAKLREALKSDSQSISKASEADKE